MGQGASIICSEFLTLSYLGLHLAMIKSPGSSSWRDRRYLVKYVLLTIVGGTSFVNHLCYLCLVFAMLSRLFIAALWSPAGNGLTSWLLFVMFNCVFVTFPCGILDRV